ncbi:MAG: M14 family zinc carboxypeptidase, partial [candidate division WOR-3 bacterium]
LVGAHHGNEKISTEITLSFLKYLLENYATNQQVNYLVNNREIWIVPILNADGHVNNSRYNGAGVDINRDYGYMWQGEGNSPSPWSQLETRAILKHSQNNNISLEYEYHSTASYVNYVWDHMPIDPPDSAYIIQISQEYADSTYGSSLTQLVKTNGYDWYYVRGSAQDAAFGIFGNIGTTIETQYPTTQAKVDSICLANRRALMAMITRAGWGISGIVRDSITQAPLFAMVKFISPKRWTVYTDKLIGDFHKMLPAGNYTFRVEANGYQPKTLNVTVPANDVVEVTIDLIPDSLSLNHVQKLIWVRRDRPDMVFRTITIDGLGIPDSNYYSLGPTGQIVLEADPPIRNFPGNDFIVYEGDATPEYYTVAVSNDWRGTFYSYGSVSGTQAFDLAAVGMDSVRYLKIVNAGGGSSSDPYAGFDLDGISYRQNPLSFIKENTNQLLANTIFQIYPNPAKTHLNIKLASNSQRLISPIFTIYDIVGNVVKKLTLNNNPNCYWKLDISNLPAGVYFCLIDNTTSTIYKQKIIINR